VVDLGSLVFPSDINDRGQIVGGDGLHSYLSNRGALTEIPAAGEFVFAAAINNRVLRRHHVPERKDAPFAKGGNEEWLATVDVKGFERVQPWYWALWRPLYPEQLLTETDIEVEAERLAVWVLDTFRQVAASPPPA
jgi:hypothetical protein